MAESRDLTIGIVIALGLLVADYLAPLAAAILAAAGLAWLIVRVRRTGVRRALVLAFVALIAAAAVALLMR